MAVVKKFSMVEFEAQVKSLGIKDADLELIKLKDVSLNEEIKWMSSLENPVLTFDELIQNRRVGSAITRVEIDEENAFIDPSLYMELIACKKLYENMSETVYQILRAHANLFETVRKGPFLCRAAMKMANMDTILNHELTEPKDRDGVPLVARDSLLYFADVCAGPGGFTEYVLWKKKWEAKGFGLTLKGALDFDLKNFIVEHESFETFYGEAGDGDIYNPVNVSGYIQHVLGSTGNKGVHLMMADGGFTVSKKENLQEVLSHQIILAQVYVALSIVRGGGSFICKLFDTVTPFTIALIYFVCQSFESVTIHKPLTSRPSNSERYLICKWKKSKDVTVTITNYLADCHELLWKFSQGMGPKMSILELVQISTLACVSDPFYIYMRDSNNRFARKQIDALKRLVPFVRDRSLENRQRQEVARKQAIQHWNIPEKIPLPRIMITCGNACQKILGELPLTMLQQLERDLPPINVEILKKAAYDWRFVPVAALKNSSNRGFYMSLGQTTIYRHTGRDWATVNRSEPFLELPSKTLVYGEFVHEISGVGDQKANEAFHIIDGLSLGGIDLRNLHYTQRIEASAKFALAMTKPGLLPIRSRNPLRVEHLAEFMKTMQIRGGKGVGVGARVVCPLTMTESYPAYVTPVGILFLKITKDPWKMELSKKTNRKYFFNTANGVSTDQVPEEAVSGFFNTMMDRVLWTWDKETFGNQLAVTSS